MNNCTNILRIIGILFVKEVFDIFFYLTLWMHYLSFLSEVTGAWFETNEIDFTNWKFAKKMSK
jgi:hypothetical protein